VRRVPPPGKKISDEDRDGLENGVNLLVIEIALARKELNGKPALLELLPDIEIFRDAVHYALKYDEFFKEPDKKTGVQPEVVAARKRLQTGMERAKQLRSGKPAWTTATGLVVRGYRSKIDGSVQPYGLVVPASFEAGNPRKHRLDLWFHGRGETL